MKPRRLQSETIFSMVAASSPVLAIRANLAVAPAATEEVGICALWAGEPAPAVAEVEYGGGAMVSYALRPISHITAWIVWQSMRVSILEDLDAPRPPHAEHG